MEPNRDKTSPDLLHVTDRGFIEVKRKKGRILTEKRKTSKSMQKKRRGGGGEQGLGKSS